LGYTPAQRKYQGEFALFGMFGRVDYSFADKYLITGIVRRDGVSRFVKVIISSTCHLTAQTVANSLRTQQNSQFMDIIERGIVSQRIRPHPLTFRTNFGIDYTNNYSYRMEKKNLEFSETPGDNNLEEKSGFNYRWMWTNTLTYNATFNDIHKLTVLLGTRLFATVWAVR